MIIPPEIKERISSVIMNREFIRITETEVDSKNTWKITNLNRTEAIT